MRHANANWNLDAKPEWDGVKVALLMDLRDGLQVLDVMLQQILKQLQVLDVMLQQILKQLQVTRRCPKHPRYTATRRPRTACAGCHRYWKAVWR